MAITVCIVDDTSEIRHALEEIIRLSDEFQLVGSFSSGEECMANIPVCNPMWY